jgi:hypothetical protein
LENICIMKKIFKKISLLALIVTIFSCYDSDLVIDNVLKNTTSGGFLRTLAINGTTYASGVNFTSANLTFGSDATPFTLLLELQDESKGENIEKIEAYFSFKKNSVATPVETTPLLWKTFSPDTFTPGTVGLPTLAFATTLGQIRTALAITTAQYSGGDQFYVTFKYIMKDGRVFTNTNSNANVVGGAYMRSPFKYTLNVVCPITESLAGAHTYVTNSMKAGSGGGISGASCGGTVTGTVTFGATPTPGVYTTTDLGFGQFSSSCWGDSPATSAGARIRWFCNNLVTGGGDQYGDTYAYTITAASGSKITITWINTYGDAGTTVITRAGGANWPAIFTR